MKQKLTQKWIDDLAAEVTQKRTDYFDTDMKGLCLRHSPGGAAFYYLKRIEGRLERIKLGDHPSVTLKQVRDKAKALAAEILKGSNPAEIKRTARVEPTFRELLTQYVQQKHSRNGHGLREKTKRGYLKLLDTHLKSIADLKISNVTAETLRRLKIDSAAQTNRSRAVIGAVFRWAQEETLIDRPNPAGALKSRFVKPRERFLQPDELTRFFEALERNPMRDFFEIALFTGQRRANVQAMKWANVDLCTCVWRIDGAETKNSDTLIVPLIDEAVKVLKRRKNAALVHQQWVFPGRRSRITGEIGHLVEPKKAWAALLKEAGIENLRIHDLRRTFGSWQASQGVSLQVIGKSLGHRSTQATTIYSRLHVDPVRKAMELASNAILEAAGKKS